MGSKIKGFALNVVVLMIAIFITASSVYSQETNSNSLIWSKGFLEGDYNVAKSDIVKALGAIFDYNVAPDGTLQGKCIAVSTALVEGKNGSIISWGVGDKNGKWRNWNGVSTIKELDIKEEGVVIAVKTVTNEKTVTVGFKVEDGDRNTSEILHKLLAEKLSVSEPVASKPAEAANVVTSNPVQDKSEQEKESGKTPCDRDMNQLEQMAIEKYTKQGAKAEFVISDIKPDASRNIPQKVTIINANTFGAVGNLLCAGYYKGDGVLNVPKEVLMGGTESGTINLFMSGKAGTSLTLYIETQIIAGIEAPGFGGVVFLRDGGKYGLTSESVLQLDNVGVWGTRLIAPLTHGSVYPKAKGSVWRIGTSFSDGVRISEYQVTGDPNDPISFALLDEGLTYIYGSGAVSKYDEEEKKWKVIFEKAQLREKKPQSKEVTKTEQMEVTEDEVSQHSVLYQMGVDVNVIKDGKTETKRIAVYGVAGLRFPVRNMEVDHRAKLSSTIIDIEDAKGNYLIPAKESAVPLNMGFDENEKAGISFFTHALNVTWRFSNPGIKFYSGDSSYEVQKVGASISFTEDGVKLDGVKKTTL